MNRKILNKCINIAYKLCPVSTEMRCSHIAFLIKNNDIFKIGWNKKRTHPLTKIHPYHGGNVYLHAEVDAILRSRKDELYDYKMLVLRVNRENQLCNSKPCPGCQSLIKQFSLSEIWYSDIEGSIVKL